MKPPGKTTLFRMQTAAHNEATRIEISQDGAITLGWRKEPLPEQIKLRDDFMGVVRLIDAIESDSNLKDRLLQLLEAGARSSKTERPDTEIVPIDEEVVAE